MSFDPCRQWYWTRSPFDDGSEVQGIDFTTNEPDDAASIFVAVAKAGVGNGGASPMAASLNGVYWGTNTTTGLPPGAGLPPYANLPVAPADLTDVAYSGSRLHAGFPGNLFLFICGRAASQPTKGVWTSDGDLAWGGDGKGITASFPTAFCCPTTGGDWLIVGGELDSGTGKLFGARSGSGTPNAQTSPIDDQFFRVTQIAWDLIRNIVCATIRPVGAVSSVERILTGTPGDPMTWTLRSSPLDGLAAYGVVYSPGDAVFVVAGGDRIVTSADGGVTWQDEGINFDGAHFKGKLGYDDNCGRVYCPGGDTNTIVEFAYGLPASNGYSSPPTELPLMLQANVAQYAPLLDVGVVGGIAKTPGHAIYSTVGSPVVPCLNAYVDLGVA